MGKLQSEAEEGPAIDSSSIEPSTSAPRCDDPLAEQSVALDPTRNEVLRRLGRNVLLFQQIEGLLKSLLVAGSASGYASELVQKRNDRAERINIRTMGGVVGELFENHFGGERSKDNAPESPSGIWLSYWFGFDLEPSELEGYKAEIADMVAQRNELIHHFHQRFDFDSVASLCEAGRYLDCQREKALRLEDRLRDLAKTASEALESLGGFVRSPEFDALLRGNSLEASALVAGLVDIARDCARDDGWTLLALAGNRLRERMPEAAASMRERYGHKTLKALMLAAGLFEFLDEATERGGTRVLYRLKPVQ